MEKLLVYAYLWRLELSEEEKYNNYLDLMFLNEPDNDLLLDLELLTDVEASIMRLNRYFGYEIKSFDIILFGKFLFFELGNIYHSKAISLTLFAKKCYELYTILPISVDNLEKPWDMLSYIDDMVEFNSLQEKIMDSNLNSDLNSNSNNNKNESEEKSENININDNNINTNKEIKRCEDGSFENIMSNEETNNINLHINGNMNNIKEPNGKEIFDAKDLSNINPMNAMNEISVDVPFVENEDKKNKKPEFLDEGFEDKIKKEEKEEKDDKGEEIDKNEEEKEEEKKSEDEKDEEKKKEEEKVQMLNDIIKNEPKDEDIELEQLEEFQI